MCLTYLFTPCFLSFFFYSPGSYSASFLEDNPSAEERQEAFSKSEEKTVLRYVFAAQPLFFLKKNRLQAGDIIQVLQAYLQLIPGHSYEQELLPSFLDSQIGYWIPWHKRDKKGSKVLAYLFSYDFVNQMNYVYAEQLYQYYFLRGHQQKDQIDEILEKVIRVHFSLPTSMKEELSPSYQLLGAKGCYGLLDSQEILPAVYRKIILSYLYDPFDIEKVLHANLKKNRGKAVGSFILPKKKRPILPREKKKMTPPLFSDPLKERLVANLKKTIWEHIEYRHRENNFFWGTSDRNGVALKAPIQIGYLLLPVFSYLLPLPSHILIPQRIFFLIKGSSLMIYSYILHKTLPFWSDYFSYPVAKLATITKNLFIIFFSLIGVMIFFLLRSPKNLFAGLSKMLLFSLIFFAAESYVTKSCFRYLPMQLERTKNCITTLLVIIGIFFFLIESLTGYLIFS